MLLVSSWGKEDHNITWNICKWYFVHLELKLAFFLMISHLELNSINLQFYVNPIQEGLFHSCSEMRERVWWDKRLISFKSYFNQRNFNFDDIIRIGCSRLPKNNCIWNKGYDIIISVHDVNNNILLCDSSYIVHVTIWPYSSSIPMREVIISSGFFYCLKKQNFED